MIVGAAVMPTTPMLVPGVSGRPPEGIATVVAAVGRALGGLPPHDLAILLATAPPQRQPLEPPQWALYAGADASLGGIARPDLRVVARVDADGLVALAGATGCPVLDKEALPLGLAVLLHLLATCSSVHAPVVPLAVAPQEMGTALAGSGERIAEALGGHGRRAVLIASGDLSAGLTAAAPLGLVDGARSWDDQAVDAVASGRLDGLLRLGPEEAQRVGAIGWAPLVVLHGALAAAKIGTAVRDYRAPRGVGYLVAAGG